MEVQIGMHMVIALVEPYGEKIIFPNICCVFVNRTRRTWSFK